MVGRYIHSSNNGDPKTKLKPEHYMISEGKAAISVRNSATLRNAKTLLGKLQK